MNYEKAAFIVVLTLAMGAASPAIPLWAAQSAPLGTTDKGDAGKDKERKLESVKRQLDHAGKKLVRSAARSVSPGKHAKAVALESKEYVASYVEVDVDSLKTEVRPVEGSGSRYVGVVKYLENHYECRGKTREEALRAPCGVARSRRMNELIRYDGKWSY